MDRHSRGAVSAGLVGATALVAVLPFVPADADAAAGAVSLVAVAVLAVASYANRHTAAVAVLAVALVTNGLSASGGRPFAGVVATQLFLGAVAFSAFGVAALRAEATRSARSVELLAELAWRDPLTKVCNRPRFMAELDEALARLASCPAAVVVVDLEGFAGVNAHLGYEVGDKLLVETARRLALAAGPDPVVGRLGGNTFAVLLAVTDAAEAAEALIAKLASAMSVAAVLDGERVEARATTGRAVARPGDRPETLLEAAEADLRARRAASR